MKLRRGKKFYSHTGIRRKMKLPFAAVVYEHIQCSDISLVRYISKIQMNEFLTDVGDSLSPRGRITDRSFCVCGQNLFMDFILKYGHLMDKTDI